MEWLVCQNKDGELFIQSQPERDNMMNTLFDLMAEIPTFVVKRFNTKEEAICYVANIHFVNKLINKIEE